MGLSALLSGAQLLSAVGATAPSAGPFPYLALLTGLPKPSDTGSELQEPAYAGYARVAVDPAGWTLDQSSTILFSPLVALPVWTGGPSALIVGWALCDAAGAGHWGWAGPSVAQVIDASDPAPVWGPGAVILNLAS